MPTRITLTSAIPVPNIRFIDCVGPVIDDPDDGTLLVTVTVAMTGNVPYRPQGDRRITLRIANGVAEGIRVKASPQNEQDIVERFSTTSGVATAYTQCRAAFNTSRAAGVAQMQTLGLFGAGALS